MQSAKMRPAVAGSSYSLVSTRRPAWRLSSTTASSPHLCMQQQQPERLEASAGQAHEASVPSTSAPSAYSTLHPLLNALNGRAGSPHAGLHLGSAVAACASARRAFQLRVRRQTMRAQRQLQNAGLLSGDGQQGAFAMMAALSVPPIPGNGVSDLCTNRVFLCGLVAWFLAQFLKIFTKRYKKGVWDIRAMVDSGGMPSSHSSLCAGITTAIAIQQGFGSPLFAAALCFSVIVMYDAMGVRRHAGKQAEVLNKVIDELLDNHPVGEVKLKEVLGHTPRQVICGGLLGLAVGMFYPA